MALLAEHRKLQEADRISAGEGWEENELIFPNWLGKPIDNTNLISDFKRLLKKNGLPNIRFHDLRHTSISFLLDMGAPINTVQQRAGHSKPSITTDIYGHALAHSQDDLAERIEELVMPIAVTFQAEKEIFPHKK